MELRLLVMEVIQAVLFLLLVKMLICVQRKLTSRWSGNLKAVCFVSVVSDAAHLGRSTPWLEG